MESPVYFAAVKLVEYGCSAWQHWQPMTVDYGVDAFYLFGINVQCAPVEITDKSPLHILLEGSNSSYNHITDRIARLYHK
jgi:hypothetical protein